MSLILRIVMLNQNIVKQKLCQKRYISVALVFKLCSLAIFI